MDELRKEIRDVLLGRLTIENGAFVVNRKGLLQLQFGMPDGFESVFVFGIQCRMMWYRIPGKRKDAEARMNAALNSMGRKIALKSAPKLNAVYCTSITGQPVVLTVRMGEKDIEVFAYSGKGLVGSLSTKHVVSRFEKSMPEAMNPLPEDRIKERREEEKNKLKSPRKLKKAKKAAERKAAKDAKKEKRKTGRPFFALKTPTPGNLPEQPEQPLQPEHSEQPVQPEQPVQSAQPEPALKAPLPEELSAQPTEGSVEDPETESERNNTEKSSSPTPSTTQNKKNKKKKKRKH